MQAKVLSISAQTKEEKIKQHQRVSNYLKSIGCSGEDEKIYFRPTLKKSTTSTYSGNKTFIQLQIFHSSYNQDSIITILKQEYHQRVIKTGEVKKMRIYRQWRIIREHCRK